MVSFFQPTPTVPACAEAALAQALFRGCRGELAVEPAAGAGGCGVPGRRTAGPGTEAEGDDAGPATGAGANGAVPWRLAVEPATGTRGDDAMP
ncbi:hypothetical protein [Lentzea sp. NEAU-D7]|uniref:hypothetical protein n=1 Tax=Lentzea sp. NEAU-D7 TaxID=2994667 RepID=UPI00224B1C61|nr:hypothetical protein [Lentzea sp. NEAU-D7]MCX2951897.1 hypothetical protein [Lentzea sp. NEAU-D7]